MRPLRSRPLLIAALLAVGALILTGGVAPAGQSLPHAQDAPPAPPRPSADQVPDPTSGRQFIPFGAESAFNADDPPTAAFFARTAREQTAADRAWRAASAGAMRMVKVTYRSRDLDIPAFVFRPLGRRSPRSRPVIVWVHENIRGRFYEHYVPFVREAVARGYVVIAPEYRGSIGYGRVFFDAIDYGGAEVDDVARALGALAPRFPEIDAQRAGIVGWSHGGLIALLAVTRNPAMFDAAAAIVPVSNLLQRMTIKGDRLRQLIDPHNRFGGPPARRMDVYRQRSPFFQIDRLQTPLLVHVAENDDDVTPEESRPFIDALRARKPELADVKVYERPFGGHVFDRLVDAESGQPLNTPDQVDSWARLWRFFGRHLDAGTEAAAAARTGTPR